MVAYSFQKRFVPHIESGRKPWTIRGPRKRHARPGEPLQLYYAMRTQYCRKIVPDPVCLEVQPIRMGFRCFETPLDGLLPIQLVQVEVEHVLPLPVLPGCPHDDWLDRFAWLDGFEDAKDMSSYWLTDQAQVATHEFEMVEDMAYVQKLLIHWGYDG